ncbi:MAG: MFS transporter [Cytophagaceae bacterium]|nr:MFS transporter [Cytophagaceae bacterium]
MEYIRLFFSNKSLLSLGILLTFFSGFGKTFLISQYIPFFAEDFNLTHASFGTIYAATTIASGIVIIYIGQLIDTTGIKKYSVFITFGLIASTLLLSFSQNIILLTIAIFGLRLSGQGLMNHISLTLITRYFKRCRGKAISISVLGHALSEGILPILTVLFITEYGWRATLMITAALMFVILIPMISGALSNMPKVEENFVEKTKKLKPLANEQWSIKKILLGNQFYLIAPGIFIIPFVFTGLMFYLLPIGDDKYWSTEWISYCFMGFACANLTSSIVAGQLIDRFKARKLFRFCSLPLILGISCIILFEGEWTALVCLTLAGITIGSGVTTETAAIAEIYGLKNLGTVKSVFSTLTIIASALGPLMIGLLLDNGYGFDTILTISIAALIILSLNSFRKSTKKHKALKSVWAIPRMMIYQKAA